MLCVFRSFRFHVNYIRKIVAFRKEGVLIDCYSDLREDRRLGIAMPCVLESLSPHFVSETVFPSSLVRGMRDPFDTYLFDLLEDVLLAEPPRQLDRQQQIQIDNRNSVISGTHLIILDNHHSRASSKDNEKN